MTGAAPPQFRPPGLLPADPLAHYHGRWTARLAAHLMRRAGFGGSPEALARSASMSLDGAVDAFVTFPDTGNLPSSPPLIDDRQLRLRPAALDSQMRLQLRQARRAQDRANVSWWLNRMLLTQAPLQEKMTLYLHGHFATANNQKGIYGLDIVHQNDLLRGYALGNWQELVHDVARDIAMLKWLDNATSKKDHPNENFARELMELFTLGIGNYTEQDVRESARAFTGYTFSRRTGEFFFNEAQHDNGSKTFLGQTGAFNGDDVIDIIFAQPAAPRYFAHRLLEFFVYSDPEPELVDAFAALIRKNRFNMKPVMSTLFRSEIFYAERTYRALVKSPVEFVIGAYQLFGVGEIKEDVIAGLGRMGQIPFHPPSVKGWDGGAQWLNTQTVLARENFASSLMTAPSGTMAGRNFLTNSPPASAQVAAQRLIGTILQGDASAKSLADLEAYLDGKETTSANGAFSGENFDERMRGAAYLTMALPAYQLS